MTKLYMIICFGMVSVFNAGIVVQRLFAGEVTPMFADRTDWTSVETVTGIIREFGLPVFFSLVFAVACAFLAKLMYRDHQRQLIAKDVIIAERDATIADMRRQLNEAHDLEKTLIGQIARLEGQKEAGGGRNGTD